MSRRTMICMLATMLALSVPCSAQSSKVIAENLCARWDQAYANHDPNQILGFVDSSFVSTDEHGKRMAFSELRKQLEHVFAENRNFNPSTVVRDVQLEAGRMVVSWNIETRYEFHDPHNDWVPMIYKATGESTWERKGNEWKMVRSTTFRANTQVNPEWVADQKAIIDAATGVTRRK